MVINPIEIRSGTTPVDDITIREGYNDASNNMIIGYRAADFEIRWVDTGDDSLTLAITDVTHGVPVNFTKLPGSGWNFHISWSRLGRLSMVHRDEISEDDFETVGVTTKTSKLPSRAGRPVSFNIFPLRYPDKGFYKRSNHTAGWRCLVREVQLWSLACGQHRFSCPVR